MTAPAEGPVGPRRASGGEVLLLVAALVLTPRLFVIAPLAGLLAAARPLSGRARFFAGLAAVLAAMGVAAASGLLDQLIAAWAVLTAGAFAVLGWRGTVRATFDRALAAVAIGAICTSALAALQGVTWAGLERYASRQLADALSTMLQASGGDPQAVLALAPLQSQVSLLAALLPAQLVLGQLLGCVLAWRWHEWTADQPMGPPAGRLADFRCSEGWVWVVIVALAAVLFGATGAVWSGAANALLVAAALFVVRGAAVVRSRLPPLGALAIVLYIVAVALLAVFVLAALLALGLADNWYDFRRRTPGSSSRD